MLFFSGQHSTGNWTPPLGQQVNKLYTIQDPGQDSTTMGCARRCRSNVMWISTEWSQSCVASVTDSPVLMVCALTSRPVSYPNWLETHIECRLLDMRIWWYLTSFAVCGRTVGTMVWQIWHEPSVNLSQHYKIGSAFFGELHRLGYRWHYCVSSLSLMVLHARYLTFSVHPHLPVQETKWQLTWLWHLWYLMWWYI